MKITELQPVGRKVAVIGDGLNDVTAPAPGDVGVGIGVGTDVAIGAADVVLMRSDPLDVPIALRIGCGTLRKTRQNLDSGIDCSAAALPIAVGLFEPPFGLTLSARDIRDVLHAVLTAHDISRSSYRRTRQNPGVVFLFNGVGIALATTGLVHPGRRVGRVRDPDLRHLARRPADAAVRRDEQRGPPAQARGRPCRPGGRFGPGLGVDAVAQTVAWVIHGDVCHAGAIITAGGSRTPPPA